MGDIVFTVAVIVVAIPFLLILAICSGGGSQGGVQPRGKVSDQPPRPTPTPPIKGNQPHTPPRDWSQVERPQGGAAQPPRMGNPRAVRPTEPVKPYPPPPMPRKTGLIPGRPGEQINAGPGTWIPPMRPDKVPDAD